MAKYVLKSKYHNTQEDWVNVYNNISSYISREEIEEKINKTVERIKDVVKDKKVAYAWSGGKDSIALQIIMEKLNIKNGICAISKDMEYTDFMEFLTKNTPVGVKIIEREIKAEFLNKHPELIFPKNKKDLSVWYKIVQHKVQNDYFKENNLNLLILGRRKQDGNYTGENGVYTKKDGMTIFSPLYDWKHEDILAVIHYFDKILPNFYFKDNGFNEGTHNILSTMGDNIEILEKLYETEKEKLLSLAEINIIKEFLSGK